MTATEFSLFAAGLVAIVAIRRDEMEDLPKAVSLERDASDSVLVTEMEMRPASRNTAPQGQGDDARRTPSGEWSSTAFPNLSCFFLQLFRCFLFIQVLRLLVYGDVPIIFWRDPCVVTGSGTVDAVPNYLPRYAQAGRQELLLLDLDRTGAYYKVPEELLSKSPTSCSLCNLEALPTPLNSRVEFLTSRQR